mgnify:CR=1 FL=1
MKNIKDIIPDLLCPSCNAHLIYNNSQSSLNCENKHKWEIRSNIPRFVNSKTNYTSAFGLQWKKYRKTQLDSYSNTNISRDRLQNACAEYYKLIEEKDFIKILEVGCGAGRFTELLLSNKNVELTSVDYSDAVEANFENFSKNKKHTIIQCDINKNPF